MESQMQEQVTTDQTGVGQAQCRELMRDIALRNALQKRANGVPTYKVPEAAALLSVSQEYLYRLIQADVFPGLCMRHRRGQGRYVIPAKAVEQLLDGACAEGRCLDVGDWTAEWRARTSGGAA
ncbi:MAG: helix-turn-helix domain-containing protein [Pseudonocardiaceae bacterium]|nr:helix-turn-helix domain-containing protein [Pseudonocardiaceae bacterium]